VESIPGPLGTAATPGLLYLPGWLWGWSWWNERFWQGKPMYSEKTCPDATLSTTNPTCHTRAWTRAAAVGSQRLTASALAQPQISWLSHRLCTNKPHGVTSQSPQRELKSHNSKWHWRLYAPMLQSGRLGFGALSVVWNFEQKTFATLNLIFFLMWQNAGAPSHLGYLERIGLSPWLTQLVPSTFHLRKKRSPSGLFDNARSGETISTEANMSDLCCSYRNRTSYWDTAFLL
jgi:hypothetical protein